jgi:3-hydroxyacyl-[acyl-carrier-protein] dehydratase
VAGHVEMPDIREIMKILPHRYPFLLVDRIVEFEPGVRIRGIKNVTFNEPFFMGHFPDAPVMPGVLIIEAMAQTGGVLALSSRNDSPGSLVYFMGIDQARFRKPVTPGDQLVMECKVLKLKSRVCQMEGKAYVDGALVAEAILLSTIVEAKR